MYYRKQAFQYYKQSSLTCLARDNTEDHNVDEEWETIIHGDLATDDSNNTRHAISLLSNIWNTAIHYK